MEHESSTYKPSRLTCRESRCISSKCTKPTNRIDMYNDSMRSIALGPCKYDTSCIDHKCPFNHSPFLDFK
jgi:hypothetical protein